MSTHAAQVCEVKVGEAWITVSLAEARARHGFSLRRCPACRGPVNVAGAYNSAARLTLSHRRVHSGCPLAPKTFSGVASPHPLAVA